MHVLLMGHGRMGQIIERILKERGHEVTVTDSDWQRDQVDPSSIQVAIDFSVPMAAPSNVEWCLEKRIPVLSGTTGWLTEMPAVEKKCLEMDGTFFYASNFSVGVNIFFALNERFASLMAKFKRYTVKLKEIHHIKKLDSPSGTAITLAEKIIHNHGGYRGWIENEVEDEFLTINTSREGDVPGTHIIEYNSPQDSIELRHTAFSREGFALGAVAVAEWLPGKKGILNMRDFLGELM